MLKRRIIPMELLASERLVKTLRFGAWRDVGDPVKSSQVYSDQDADELVILDIDRRERGPARLERWLREIAKTCFVPIAAGGGIATVDDARRLFSAGADKVVVNSRAYRDRDLLRGIAGTFGAQALVVSIDVSRERAPGTLALFSECGVRRELVDLADHIAAVIEAGAGEILLTSIDRDGAMQGFDLELIEYARKICPRPLIVCGGAGHYLHLEEAFARGVDAVACGSLFNFGDNNPLRVKSFLKGRNIPLKRI